VIALVLSHGENNYLSLNFASLSLPSHLFVHLFIVPRTLLSSSLGLQCYVGLGLVHRFVMVNFSGVRLLAPHPAWRIRDCTSSGPYPLTCLAWMAISGADASASIALQDIGVRKPASPQLGGSPRGGIFMLKHIAHRSYIVTEDGKVCACVIKLCVKAIWWFMPCHTE
jgi:hypothetical protein